MLGPTSSRIGINGLNKTKGGRGENKLFFSILFGIIALFFSFSSQQLPESRDETGKKRMAGALTAGRVEPWERLL